MCSVELLVQKVVGISSTAAMNKIYEEAMAAGLRELAAQRLRGDALKEELGRRAVAWAEAVGDKKIKKAASVCRKLVEQFKGECRAALLAISLAFCCIC